MGQNFFSREDDCGIPIGSLLRTLTIFTGWIPYVTPWYAEMVEYYLKNDESVLLKPHPTDLPKFIMCNNYGILFEMHCPTGTLFDVRLKICNHNYKITNEIRDSIAPKWLTKPKKPTKTTRKTKTTTVKSIDDYDTVSNCSDFASDGFRYIIVWALLAPCGHGPAGPGCNLSSFSGVS